MTVAIKDGYVAPGELLYCMVIPLAAYSRRVVIAGTVMRNVAIRPASLGLQSQQQFGEQDNGH